MITTKHTPSDIKCSIIIPNLHSPVIGKTIESLLDQTGDFSFEIIVVGMDKWGLLEPYDDSIQIIETAQPTPPGSARNLGAQAATGDFLLFIDADCLANPDWLAVHLGQHLKADAPVIVGGGVAFPSKHYLTLAENVSSFHEYMTHLPAGERTILPSLNLSLPRQVWEGVDGFSSALTGEDIDFTFRSKLAGTGLMFEPDAAVTHLPSRRDIASIFQHTYQFGYNSIKTNPAYWDQLQVPCVLRHWLLAFLSSPLLSLGLLLKMVGVERLPLRYWHTLPMVFVLKIAWCLGCASKLRAQKTGRAE